MDTLDPQVEAAEKVQAENEVKTVEQVETPATEVAQSAPQEQTAEETQVNEVAAQEHEPKPQHTREELYEQLQGLLQSDINEIKGQVEQVQKNFYRLLHQEQAAAKEAWEAAEHEAEEIFEPAVDHLEQQFRELLTKYRQQKAELHKKQEEEMQQNQLRKENIIAQMKELAQSETADVTANLQKVRELQQEWKQIGAVPPTVASQLWKEYNLYQEQFYDLVKINNELREYDFKKNLEQKNALIEQAEKLNSKADIVEAFRQLQKLHDEWANIGPVARDMREQVWARFKEASTVINKKHQEYFEKLHAAEEENYKKKKALIEKLQAIDKEQLVNARLWDDATVIVNEIQTEWRKIGFAPKKVNQQIYDEYRKLCNEFFEAKTAFYKSLKEEMSQNLQKKRALIEKAEELKDSTDWKATSEKLMKLQKQWKETGTVARKYSDDLWKKFSTACDHFFDAKKAATQGTYKAEQENLKKKQAIIKQIEGLEVTTKDETLEQLKSLIAEYNAIGFVPFKDKNKTQEQFRNATDKIFDQLNIDAANRRIDAFSKEVESKDENALLQDRRRLVRQYEALEQEIKTAENNILFFTANSKKSNKLIDDMQRNITDRKKRLEELEKRINLIDSKIS